MRGVRNILGAGELTMIATPSRIEISVGLTEVEEAVVNFVKHFLLITAHLNKRFAGEHASDNDGSARFRHPEAGCGGVGYNP